MSKEEAIGYIGLAVIAAALIAYIVYHGRRVKISGSRDGNFKLDIGGKEDGKKKTTILEEAVVEDTEIDRIIGSRSSGALPQSDEGDVDIAKNARFKNFKGKEIIGREVNSGTEKPGSTDK